MTSELAAVFVGGVLGSSHCIGMCGGLAAAIGAVRLPFAPILARQLVYSAGRIFTYAFLGAVAGASGLYLSQFKSSMLGPQQIFSMLAGVVMLLVGISTLGWLPMGRRSSGVIAKLLAPVFKHFLNVRGWFGYFLAGIATGFLPCGLVYAFLATALATGNVGRGMLLMACFGLGTVPAMVAIGCGSAFLSQRMRGRILKIAACFVIVMGAMSIWRAWPRGDAACCHDRAGLTAVSVEPAV